MQFHKSIILGNSITVEILYLYNYVTNKNSYFCAQKMLMLKFFVFLTM